MEKHHHCPVSRSILLAPQSAASRHCSTKTRGYTRPSVNEIPRHVLTMFDVGNSKMYSVQCNSRFLSFLTLMMACRCVALRAFLTAQWLGVCRRQCSAWTTN